MDGYSSKYGNFIGNLTHPHIWALTNTNNWRQIGGSYLTWNPAGTLALSSPLLHCIWKLICFCSSMYLLFIIIYSIWLWHHSYCFLSSNYLSAIHPSIYLSIHPSVHVPLHPSIHPSIHPSSWYSTVYIYWYSNIIIYIYAYIYTYIYTYIYIIYICILYIYYIYHVCIYIMYIYT
jgi:hypothetical protein